MTCFLYPDGTVETFKDLVIAITCNFDYTKMPGDFHECATVAYIQNEWFHTARLLPYDKYNSRSKQY